VVVGEYIEASNKLGFPKQHLAFVKEEKKIVLLAQYQNRWADIEVYSLLTKSRMRHLYKNLVQEFFSYTIK
jgi:hypothetical protein